MPLTLVEKILSHHSGHEVRAGETVDVAIDTRAARDFGGANVVAHLQRHGLGIADPEHTLFTFDCNPTGSDQGYAANQQRCRIFAREHGIQLRDITQGIGTHLAIEEGRVWPGSTFVSTDSHANIVGAVGAFGQGMGDQDIAYAWAAGKVWFKVPPTLKVLVVGTPGPAATAKDIVLAMAGQLGADGMLGAAAEISGDVVERLGLAERITIASMATEMGGITALFAPSDEIVDHFKATCPQSFTPVFADDGASFTRVLQVDITSLPPMIARPGRPEDTVPVSEVAGRKIDSVFIGSCTNGRLEDLRAVARVLADRPVAPGVVMKVVPATRRVWQQALEEGIIARLLKAGALVGNPGCGGCAAGQIGQNGPGEVTVSTGNRNYPGKQGGGEVYLASPETAAASAVAGVIAQSDAIPDRPVLFPMVGTLSRSHRLSEPAEFDGQPERPTTLEGRVWLLDRDNIDTDMIYHNRHLAETDAAKMSQHTCGNLPGYEDLPNRVRPGDIIVAGANFGCGSSRQQAVDCFKALGVTALIARSFGAIYERNALNAGLAVLVADLLHAGVADGQVVWVDLKSGLIRWQGGEMTAQPLSDVNLEIYQRGGLLTASRSRTVVTSRSGRQW